MYANTTSGKIKTGQINNFISLYETTVKPVVMKIPGLVNLYVLTDNKNSQGLIVAVYETKEDADNAEMDGHVQQAIGELASTLILESISRNSYDVSIHI